MFSLPLKMVRFFPKCFQLYSIVFRCFSVLFSFSSNNAGLYHGIGADPSIHGRRDRIYRPTVVGSDPRDRAAAFAELGDRGRAIVRVAQLSRTKWNVRYTGGLRVVWQLRQRMRWHKAGLPLKIRKRDFGGPCVTGRAYMLLPGDSSDPNAIRSYGSAMDDVVVRSKCA